MLQNLFHKYRVLYIPVPTYIVSRIGMVGLRFIVGPEQTITSLMYEIYNEYCKEFGNTDIKNRSCHGMVVIREDVNFN